MTVPIPLPTVVPINDWQLLTGDPMSPYAGSSNGVVITQGVNPIRVANAAFFMTVVCNKPAPGSPTTLALETDDLVLWQEYTIIDGAMDAELNPITVSASPYMIDGAAQRVINVVGRAETYQWDGTQFRIKSTGAM